jgi:site-specific DNA recombinase
MNKPTGSEQRAILYLRAARRPQRERETTIEAQRYACERRASERGLEVVREYVDYGTGGWLDQGPGLRELLGDLKLRREADWVITYDYARMARTVLEHTYALWDIQAAGARLEIASASRTAQDRDGPIGQRMRRIGEQQHQRPE